MKVAFCGGGTGGHVYPALTVAQALRGRFVRDGVTAGVGAPGSSPEGSRVTAGDLDLLYIGVRGKIDAELVAREKIPFRAVTAGPLRSASLLGTAKGMLKLLAGTAESYRLLGQFRPDVVFATGGYGSVGVGLAARLRKLPLLLFEPGPEAGLAVKLLARVASRIAVTIPPAYEAMPRSKTQMLGYPVRSAFFEAERSAARSHFGLTDDLPVLLVSGASSGANRINKAIAASLRKYLEVCQLVHLTGPNDEAWMLSERDHLPPALQARYHVYAYLHGDMPLALAASDLAVMRSGASVLGELPAAGLPAILIPGEYEGWDQSNNARYLESEGAAVMLMQARIDELLSTVTGLLASPQRLQEMRDSLARLARPDAAERLAGLIIEMGRAQDGVAA